ncbi:MAG: amidohydrolase family protein [Vicinamibacterales bacterium]|nr:amidohydrolase family protein [Vicinamibacterales bacterium]
MLLPSRTAIVRTVVLLVAVAAATLLPRGAAVPVAAQGETMTVADVMKMPKIDAHAHIGGMSPAHLRAFVAFLEKHNLRWLNIAVSGMDWGRLSRQIGSAQSLHAAYPDRLFWATSFTVSNWGASDWASSANATIDDGFRGGAVAVKIWKDVGMVLKDPDGRFVMADDPRLDPVFNALVGRNRTLVAHLGEPRNCWLPLDQMTVDGDRRYFAAHPEYHGLLHPEIPDYEAQIAARDRMLERHPQLRVVGCHLGSLEYDVDQLAKRLDKYPNFAVDLAARIVHLQIQPREKVRAFFVKYQDRILYGTDLDFGRGPDEGTSDIDGRLARLAATYESDAAWLATDQEVDLDRVRAGFRTRGVALPSGVLRKVYYENAKRWYPGL